MSIYEVTLTRTIKQTQTYTFSAESAEHAEDLALRASTGDVLSWEIDSVTELPHTPSSSTVEPGAIEFID